MGGKMSSVADHYVRSAEMQSVRTKVPIQNTECSIFDDTFSFLKEKLATEMEKVETDMKKFSADLIELYNAHPKLAPKSAWQTIYSSPLVEGEGNDMTIKLQFDVSQFEPCEVDVLIIDDSLYVCAAHEEKGDDRSVYRELKREFLLPKGIDPKTVISSISREGILTVQAPLPMCIEPEPACRITNSTSPISIPPVDIATKKSKVVLNSS